MAAPKLSPETQNRIIEMLAAREPYKAIADMAGCTIPTIDYYAKKYAEKIAIAQAEYDARFIDRGLRSRHKRIEKLEALADNLEYEMSDRAGELRGVSSGLWTRDVKSVGNNPVELEVFASGIVSQYRATLDDIAKELGHRVSKNEISGPNGEPLKAYINVDTDKV